MRSPLFPFLLLGNVPELSQRARGTVATILAVLLVLLPPFASAQDPPPAPESGIDLQVIEKFGTATPAERVELIHLYERLGNAEMVKALSEKILESSPDDPGALELLAAASLKSADSAKALLYTGRLMDLNPTPEVRTMRVFALSLAGRTREALPLLLGLKADSPQDAFALQEDLAFALLESGQVAEAKAAFQEILDVPGYTPAAITEAKKQLAAIRFDELLGQGDATLKDNDTTAARAVLEKLEAEFPKTPQTRAFSARILIAEGRHSDALVVLENLVEDTPEAAFDVQNDIAYIFVEMKDWDVARESFQKVLNTKGYPADSVAQARKALAEIDLYQRLEVGYKAAKKRDKATVREIADWANQADPTNPDVRAFEAKAKALEGDHAAAKEILLRLEQETPPGEVFSHSWDLGEALYETGDFRGAAENLSAFARTPNRKPSDRLDAFFSLASLKEDYFGQARTSADSFSGTEGDQLGLEAYVRSKISPSGWRTDTTYRRDEISLKDTLLDDSRVTRQEGAASFEKFFDNSLFAKVFFGGSDDDLLAGFSLGKSARSTTSAWAVDTAINERATDSLTLHALDGRQNRAGFTLTREFSERLQFGFDALARKVDIQGRDFGNGYGTDIDLAFRLNPDWRRTNVALAYTGSYHRFNPDNSWLPPSSYDPLKIAGTSPDALAAELIDLEYHRHGIELRLDGLIGSTLIPYATTGLHYRFDGVGFEYGVAGGFEWYLSSDTAFALDASYYSSGQAGNSGSGTFAAIASLRHAF